MGLNALKRVEKLSSLKYKNQILEFSLELNEIQKPIQILEAVKWNEEHENFIIKNNFKELPKVTYHDRPLKFDPDKKLQEFKQLRFKITKELGANDPLAKILIRNCLQYEDVVAMLKHRGNNEFYNYSKKLYGSPTEMMANDKTTLFDFSQILDGILSSFAPLKGESFEKVLTSEMIVDMLKERLSKYFVNESIKVKLSDGILSDASAGSDYIKIKKDMMFAKRDLDIFEVHEGWVHLGTTINGHHQPFAKWLAKGPPCSTITQEGLAVMTELLSFSLFPLRAKRLNDRLLACKMAEDGADLLQVIEFYREKGQGDLQAIRNAGRIFRGANLKGGMPFTKDIAYLKGFMMVYYFLNSALRNNKEDQIPYLFSGKVTIDDIPVLHQYHQEGVIVTPKYLPPPFANLQSGKIQSTFSTFKRKLNIESIKRAA